MASTAQQVQQQQAEESQQQIQHDYAIHCIINHDNFIIFHKTLQCLSRISSNIILDISSVGMTIRALSDSQSAYAHYYYPLSYFDQVKYSNQIQNNILKQQQIHNNTKILNIIKCKLSIRLLLHIFKQINNIQQVHMTIETYPVHNIVFELIEESTYIKRIYRFSYEEPQQIQQVEISRKTANTILSCDAKILLNAVNSFVGNTNDIIINANQKECIISTQRNLSTTNTTNNIYDKDEITSIASTSHTEYTIHSSQFKHYQFDSSIYNIDIQFHIDQFKVFIAMCSDLKQDINIFINSMEQPIILSNCDLNIFDKFDTNSNLQYQLRYTKILQADLVIGMYCYIVNCL